MARGPPRRGREPAQHAYERELERRSAQYTALAAGTLSVIWLARGRVRTALRWSRESTALLRDVDAVGMLPWALAGLAQAAAQAGEAELARGAVHEMELRPLGHKGFECELGLARAWSAAADGELSRAHAQALAAADLAQSRGQAAFALRALHVLCRFGEAAGAAPRIARLADHVDGPFAQLAAAHAAALVARDGRTLLEVADHFGALDARLLAAEAAQAAAAAHHAAGREASARGGRALRPLAGALRDCRPPTLLAGSVQELTPREREIALLAASGLTSRQIAERLVVSVRTVDNHLQHAYRKLGIARREELPGVLI